MGILSELNSRFPTPSSSPTVHFESFPAKRGFRDECSKQGSRGSVLLTALLSGDGWRLGEVTCLLRDGRDLLPAWHRLKTDKGAVARGLRRGRTWGHWRVPSSPWEECLLKPSSAVRQRDLAVPGKLDREGFVFPLLSPLRMSGMALPHPRPCRHSPKVQLVIWVGVSWASSKGTPGNWPVATALGSQELLIPPESLMEPSAPGDA